MKRQHPTFSGLAAPGTYPLADVIEHLENKVQAKIALAQKNVSTLIEDVLDSAFRKASTAAGRNTKDITEINNALIVAKRLVEIGHQTITINPAQNLYHQILARADEVTFEEERAAIAPETYRKKLGR